MMKNSLEEIIAEAQQASTWLAHRKAARQITEQFSSGEAEPKASLKVAFLSSFTVDPLVDFMVVQAAACGISLQTHIAPFGQVSQEILNPESGLYTFGADVTVLMAEANSLSSNPLEAAGELVKLSQAWQQKGTGILVVCTFMASPDWPLHLLEPEKQIELKQANHQLKEAFKENPCIQICDLDALAAYYGYANAVSPEMMAMARIPFAEGFLSLLSRKLISHLKAQAGMIRKCLVLDCDNTLWGGIIGEDGIDGIALGPDWPGREFVDFQKAILELYEQGVILAINSKNNEADVMQVLREHPHMILKEEHFAAIRVNWDTKPDNMKLIADEVNIGIDTFVFVDDNPAERQMMAQMLPEVAVLDLPANPALYATALRETNLFAKASLTEEDKNRGQMYAAQRQRTKLEKTSISLQDYLKSLEMVCSIRPAEEKDIKRVAQLTQRTNQFNLTTRRYTEADIRHMLESPEWNVYVLGLKDKFGDNGTVGLALVETKARNGSDVMTDNAVTTWRIDTFLMSCRVIGRQAEDAFVDRICQDAVSSGTDTLEAEYIKTAKNALVSDFWDKMNFTQTASDECSACYCLSMENYKATTFEYLTM